MRRVDESAEAAWFAVEVSASGGAADWTPSAIEVVDPHGGGVWGAVYAVRLHTPGGWLDPEGDVAGAGVRLRLGLEVGADPPPVLGLRLAGRSLARVDLGRADLPQAGAAGRAASSAAGGRSRLDRRWLLGGLVLVVALALGGGYAYLQLADPGFAPKPGASAE